VTAGKEGYSFFTVFGIDAREMTLPLRQQGASIARPIYDGDITGFQAVSNDGIVDLALVWRTFSVRELVSFSSDLLGGSLERFSPTVGENFPLVGLQPVPGAVYLPLQYEFLFIPLSRKPYYIYVEDNSVTDISAVHARMPIMTLLNELAKPKPDFLALVRVFDVRNYALEEGIDVNGPDTQDLTLDIGEGAPVRMHVGNTASDRDVLAIALADLDGLSGYGRLMPCGFGGSRGGVDTLLALSTLGSGAPGSIDYLAGALQSDTVEGLASTAVFVRSGLDAGDTAQATVFLTVPSVALLDDRFEWTSMASPSYGLFPDVQRAGISLVTTIPDTNAWAEEGDTLDIPTPLWSFFLGGTDTSFVLPCLGTAIASPMIDPTGTPAQDRLDWAVTGIGLGLAPAFDYDDWDIVDLGLCGTHLASNTEKFISAPEPPFTDVETGRTAGTISLEAPRPNPFRGETRIRFGLAGGSVDARLAVYDISGRRVRSLAPSGGKASGGATWDGKDDRGRSLPSGVYLFRLETGGEVLTRKVVKTR
jgi:hypothetical protein